MTASSQYAQDRPEAAVNGVRPQSSAQADFARWSSSGDDRDRPWIQMAFHGPQPVERIAVSWAEEPESELALPLAWSMEVLMSGKWKSFDPYITCFHGTKVDTYNVMYPAAVQSIEGLRIVMDPQEGKRVGILDIDLTTGS